MNLEISNEQIGPIHWHHGTVADIGGNGRLSPEQVETLAEEYDISTEIVEAFVAEVR